MIKNSLMAAAVAVTAGVLAMPQDADAKHKEYHDDDVNIQFQFGFGTPNYNDGYYYPGHPSYRPGYRRGYNRVSCGEARAILRDRNYRRISTVECNGRTYTFRAWKGNRGPRIVYVNSRNGGVSG